MAWSKRQTLVSEAIDMMPAKIAVIEVEFDHSAISMVQESYYLYLNERI